MSALIFHLTIEDELTKIKDILKGVDDLSLMHDYDFRTPLHIAAINDKVEIA